MDVFMSTHEIVRTKSLLNVYFDVCETTNHIVPSHWHKHLELIFILRGTMHVISNEKNHTLHTKDLFIVNSGDIHYTRSVGKTKLLLLQIPYEFLNQIIFQFDTIHFTEHFSYDQFQEDAHYQSIVKHLLVMEELYINQEEGYQFLFTSHLHLLLHVLYTNYTSRHNMEQITKEEKSLERIKEIIAYVEEHYMEPLTLQEVADLFALNPEYFCRYFKKNTGFTFLQYVNMVRLPHIYEDIIQTKDSITQIQERHGFSNYKIMNRMFKELYCCLPSEARKNSIQR